MPGTGLESGVHEFLPDRRQLLQVGPVERAVFRTNDDLVFATDHRDPRSRALVMARGIVGRTGQYHTVASPLYKETYDLATGRCVSGAEYTLPVHPVRVQDGRVLVVVSGRDEQGGGEQGE
ncbi:nitrite reductase small subunit NirD [Kocuria sp.]|uniref:nitrite reductase small subunit NirD n=1 Tax=Kocuria sp. TaxID=1871328 RepID=UPI0028A6144D|nr:nitrite reductase small subunit NirD [Kocuria sp.]